MLKILINEILTTPAILIGLFVLLGNVLLKKSFADVLSGTFKTIIGFTMLNAGATIVGDSLGNFSSMFTEAFGLQASVVNNDAYGAMLAKAFPTAPTIFILGMILNIVLAKFTRFKYLFLAGNVSLSMAGIISLVLSMYNPIITIVFGSIFLALYMTLSPAITQKYTAEITGSKEFAVANPGSTNYFIAAKLGSIFGNKEKSTEDIKVHDSLSFLQDSTISMALTMSILFIFISSYIGPEYVEQNLSNGQNYISFSFMQAITFTVGVLVLMNGISMVIEELIPAFRGIGDKLIDGVVPAVDGAVMAKYAPNAMVIGFLVSFSTGFLTMFLLTLTKLPVIIPSVLEHFFVGGIAATYGNKTGGRRGAIIGAFMNGLMMTIIPSIYLVYAGGAFDSSVIFSDSDFGIIGIIVEFISRLFG